MIDRRAWFWAPFLAILSTSCATEDSRQHPRFTLGEMLAALPSIRSINELYRRFGAPFAVSDFQPNRPEGRGTREGWKEESIATPPDLIDKLQVGTPMMAYIFLWDFDMFNPRGGDLYVFADDNGQILGWVYDKSLQQHSKKALIRN